MTELSSREMGSVHLPVGRGSSELSVRAGEKAPAVCRSPMPTQVIEFWTPPLICRALLRALNRSRQESSAISDEI